GEGADEAIKLAKARELEVFTIGAKGAFIRLESVAREGFKQRLTLTHDHKKFTILLPLAGDFQVSNALVAAGLWLSVSETPENVFTALEHLHGAKGRLDYAGQTHLQAPIFIDYAHTPDALEKALLALRPYVSGRLFVIFGCGGNRDKGKRPLMGQIAARFAD